MPTCGGLRLPGACSSLSDAGALGMEKKHTPDMLAVGRIGLRPRVHEGSPFHGLLSGSSVVCPPRLQKSTCALEDPIF